MSHTSTQTPIFNKRHSLAHILLMAIKHDFPHALPTIGPVTETGFYYDIDFVDGTKLTSEDLPKLQKTMVEILKRNLAFKKETITADIAEGLFSVNPFKLELISGIKEKGEDVTLYYTGEDFFDLCEGPHVDNTNNIATDSFMLSHLAGAYWRGDETKPMLTRIYGLAFNTKEELDAYILQQEEAKKRDHRLLGKQLKLFTFSDLVGSGLPLWTPRGTIIREELNDFVWSLRKKQGYQKVTIPHITKNDLYIKSGHWAKYAEDLFKINTRDGHTFCMKPMNCPHHAQIYASELRSYRELPLRFCETTMVYRDEQSGELSGLARVLSITQDDAHVFCRESQLEEEITSVWKIIEDFYSTFGFTLVPRFSRRDPENPEKYMGSEEGWNKAENAIKSLLEKKSADTWIDGVGEAAFYGPKVDFMAKDSIGRTWQVATVQLDFVQPTNFGLEFVNEEGKREQPVMIHCAIMGSIERFMSTLIEHVAGNFPLWLSPVQISVIPIRESHNDYAKIVHEKLTSLNVRSELDDSKDGLGKKVRNTKDMKTPYWAVIGDAEVTNNTVTLEHITLGKIGEMSVDELTEKLSSEIKKKQ
ncbi:MAG: threonine--tRNA ligase [Candidatus Pacebacteria bacterium]|nr:threonine--tRNA ligase [Candidatus Paceibacterota bacterium]MBP9866511.1 threonine--tRNA ligase [Candidatus Paceibacterota bacterium]